MEVKRKLFYWLDISNFLYIIVLLILAGITINSIFGSDSVLNKATQAKEEDSHGTVKDQINLELVNYELSKGTEGADGTSIKYLADKEYFTEAYNADTTSYVIDHSKINGVSLGKGTTMDTGDVYVIEKESDESDNWVLRYYKTSSEVKDLLELKVDGGVVTGTTIEEAAKNGLLHVGDYVAYTPDIIGAGGTVNLNDGKTTLNKLSSKTYTAEIANTGYEEDQTIEQEKLNWRIFSVNQDTGEVLLVSETPTHRALALKGSVGWLNAETELNNACRELYSSSKLGEARHLTMEDINKAVGYDPKTQVEGYNEEKSTSKAIYYPDENGDMTYDDDGYTLNKLKQDTYTRPAGMTPYNSYDLKDSSEPVFNQMITGGPTTGAWYYETSDGESNSTSRYIHWLASRDVSVYSDYARFYVRFLCAGSERGNVNYGNNLFNGYDSYAYGSCVFESLRPIVTLNSKVPINTDDGQEEHNTQETAWEIY